MQASETLTGRSQVNYPSLNLAYCAIAGFCVVAIAISAALFIRPGYALTAFGDLVQILLVGLATFLFLRNARTARGSARGFWFLLALGFAIWLGSLFPWVYFEVWMRRPVPDFPFGDLLLFVKPVPLVLALALQPQEKSSHRSHIFWFLDLSLLLVYWLYLYAFWVFVYRLVPDGLPTYNFHYNAFDALGNHALLLAAGVMALRSKRPWRMIYQSFFLACALYCLASDLSNVAIDAGTYYTGNLYDVPLVASMAAFVWMGLAGRQIQLTKPPAAEMSVNHSREMRNHSHWTSLLGMLVTLSTPFIGLALLLSANVPGTILHFRILATLVSMLVLSVLVIIKQDLLSAHLMRSLQEVSKSYINLTRFKGQLLQNEKLASLGHLVAGVANEIKNAMTEILACVARLTPHSHSDSTVVAMTQKISQYACRTNGLVESMLSFARETPLQIASINVNSLLESAINLNRAAKNRSIRTILLPEEHLPAVSADADQLLHVFMHVISNAADAMEGAANGELLISTKFSGGHVVIEFADSGTGMQDPDRVFEPFYTTKSVGKGTGLGLSTCYGIIHRHGGEITCRNKPQNGAIFTLSLPAAAPAAAERSILAGELALREK